MKLLIAVLTASAMLSACAVYTPSGSVIVDPAGLPRPAGGGGGGFCPPGQAKKGNC